MQKIKYLIFFILLSAINFSFGSNKDSDLKKEFDITYLQDFLQNCLDDDGIEKAIDSDFANWPDLIVKKNYLLKELFNKVDKAFNIDLSPFFNLNTCAESISLSELKINWMKLINSIELDEIIKQHRKLLEKFYSDINKAIENDNIDHLLERVGQEIADKLRPRTKELYSLLLVQINKLQKIKTEKHNIYNKELWIFKKLALKAALNIMRGPYQLYDELDDKDDLLKLSNYNYGLILNAQKYLRRATYNPKTNTELFLNKNIQKLSVLSSKNIRGIRFICIFVLGYYICNKLMHPIDTLSSFSSTLSLGISIFIFYAIYNMSEETEDRIASIAQFTAKCAKSAPSLSQADNTKPSNVNLNLDLSDQQASTKPTVNLDQDLSDQQKKKK